MIYRRFYEAALKTVRDHRAEYDAEVRRWYEESDGRDPEWVEVYRCQREGSGWVDPPCGWFTTHYDEIDGHENQLEPGHLVQASGQMNYGGKGYRFPHCIHGSSLWTDYDNICGGCEDSLTVFQEAHWLACGWCGEYQRRLRFMREVPANLPAELREGIAVWALEALRPIEALSTAR